MPCFSRRVVGYGVLLFSLGASSCDRSPALPRTYPAAGTVTFAGGRPLTGGTIVFTAVDPLIRVVGDIGNDCTFTLLTAKDTAKAEGAPEGEYRVFVIPPRESDPLLGAHKSVPPIALPTPYRVEAKENRYTIVLPSPPTP